jgi:hypothetical protein
LKRVSQFEEDFGIIAAFEAWPWLNFESLGALHIIMKTFTHVRAIANAIRVSAAVWGLCGVCCFFPIRWINGFFALFGVEPLPQCLPVDLFLRWGILGSLGVAVVLWVVATDVVRYRPLVITIIAFYLIVGVVSYLMEIIIGMPFWWRIMDCGPHLVMGGLILVCCLWPAKKSPSTAPEPTATAL